MLWPPIPTALFEKIIRNIKKKFHVVLLEDYLSGKDQMGEGENLATISFDDGYIDNYQFAAPILLDNQCPASFYIVTDCIERNVPTWTFITDAVFLNNAKGALKLEYDFVPEKFRCITWNTLNEGISIGKEIKPWMKSLGNTKRISIMKELELLYAESPSYVSMMTWKEVEKMKDAGFCIGSHSHTHPMLANLEEDEEIEVELSKSFDLIQNKLGMAPISISYPIGSWDQRVIKFAKKTGYQLGLAVEQRDFKVKSDSNMIIPRVELYKEPYWKSSLRMNGLYQQVKRFFK